MSIEEILHDPAWFPDRIDAANRLIRLTRTSHNILSASAFLDGRTALSPSDGEHVIVDLGLYADALAGEATAMRWIFHKSFCGSTLLARTIDIRGYALCLREPQILIDLANWKLASPQIDAALFRATLSATMAKLSQRWQQSEAIVVKPSNWIGAILPDLWIPDRGDRAVVVDVGAEPFLVSVLRGGRDRVAYTLRVYQQLIIAWPLLGNAAEAGLGDGGDPLLRATRLVAATYWAQDCLLRARAMTAGTTLEEASLRFPDFLKNGNSAIRFVDTRLALGCQPNDLEQSVDHHFAVHSKRDGHAAPSADEEKTNKTIRQLHSANIAAAMRLLGALEESSLPIIAALAEQMQALR